MVVLIALIAFVPFALAWFFTRHPELLHQRSNYGSLITPAQPLPYDLLLSGSSASATPLQQAKGRWIVLQITAGPCDGSCRTSLQASRQIRLLLNKDIARVQRLLLTSGPPPVLPDPDEDLLLGTASGALIEKLSRIVGRPIDEGMVILIDPFANAMMWYPPGFDPYGILRDLKHLLRSSQIG